MGTPFRDSVVVNTWPYLGAALTSSVDGDIDSPSEEQETSTGPPNGTDRGDDDGVTHYCNTLVTMGAVVITPNRNDSPTANHCIHWNANMGALLAYQV